MTVKQKARQLALTLVGEDQNPQPIVEVLIEMAAWQREKMVKEIFASVPPATPKLTPKRRCKFYETLGWRKCRHEELNQRLNIRTSESGHRYLIVDGYEIEIETLLKSPKEG